MKKNLQILLIDDDDDEYGIFVHLLDQIDEDIDCYHANSAEFALNMLATTSYLPDFIFLDLNMPRMDGRECLRKLEKLYTIPVIIYTTSDRQKDIDDSKTLGAEWYLVKPRLIEGAKTFIAFILYNHHQPNYVMPAKWGIYRF